MEISKTFFLHIDGDVNLVCQQSLQHLREGRPTSIDIIRAFVYHLTNEFLLTSKIGNNFGEDIHIHEHSSFNHHVDWSFDHKVKLVSKTLDTVKCITTQRLIEKKCRETTGMACHISNSVSRWINQLHSTIWAKCIQHLNHKIGIDLPGVGQRKQRNC